MRQFGQVGSCPRVDDQRCHNHRGYRRNRKGGCRDCEGAVRGGRLEKPKAGPDSQRRERKQRIDVWIALKVGERKDEDRYEGRDDSDAIGVAQKRSAVSAGRSKHAGDGEREEKRQPGPENDFRRRIVAIDDLGDVSQQVAFLVGLDAGEGVVDGRVVQVTESSFGREVDRSRSDRDRDARRRAPDCVQSLARVRAREGEDEDDDGIDRERLPGEERKRRRQTREEVASPDEECERHDREENSRRLGIGPSEGVARESLEGCERRGRGDSRERRGEEPLREQVHRRDRQTGDEEIDGPDRVDVRNVESPPDSERGRREP